jgi:glycogen debranching enzyme
MRPRGEEYQRFIHLVDLFRDAGWQPERMLKVSPFRVVDVATNAILLRAERDLLALAGQFGSARERSEIAERISLREKGIARLWGGALGLFTPFDERADAPIRVGISAGFLPLFAQAASDEQARVMAETLQRWGQRARWLVPSTDPGHVGFEPVRYWRGPVWAMMNWMIADGFAASGNAAMAARVRDDTRRLIEGAGFCEYFDPIAGRGAGGGDFSWTAAIYLML